MSNLVSICLDDLVDTFTDNDYTEWFDIKIMDASFEVLVTEADFELENLKYKSTGDAEIKTISTIAALKKLINFLESSLYVSFDKGVLLHNNQLEEKNDFECKGISLLKKRVLEIKSDRVKNGKAHSQMDDEYMTLIHIARCLGGRFRAMGMITQEELDKAIDDDCDWIMGS